MEIDWIVRIAPLAVYCHRKYNYPTAALIGASCDETGYGTRPLVSLANNIFGMKKKLLPYESTVWNGDTVWADTWEDVNGQAVPVKAEFRKYASIRDCMEDFCQFMAKTEKYGSHVIGKPTDEVLDYLTGRYATDHEYGQKIKDIIARHNLRKFDGSDVPEPPEIVSRVAENAWQVPEHGGNDHLYLAVHYLGKEGENPDLYNNGYGGHFYVSKDGKCYQAALVTDKIWHVGKGTAYEYIHPFARNANTVGIECATYQRDGKWYFTEKTQRAAAQLAAWLMFCLDIPVTNLLRHGDITTKHCPAPYMDYEGQGENWTWDRFKTEVKMAKKEYIGLMPGSKGERVLWWKRGLLVLGFADCAYYLDGFGDDDTYDDRTVDFTRRFQAYYGLTVDGCAGSQSQPVMESELAKLNTDKITFTVEQMLAAAKARADYYSQRRYSWESTAIAPWFERERCVISCDRYLDDVFNDLGLCLGNRNTTGIKQRLLEIGGKLITDVNEVKAGDVVIVRNGDHIFICAGHNLRYDCGSDPRIRGEISQPSSEPITEFDCAIRVFKDSGDGGEPPKPARKYTITLEQVTLGSQGASVRLLQAILKALGYYAGDIDGYFGKLTQASLNAFQAFWISKGIDIGTNGKPDSICGRGCWEKLLDMEVKPA